jgi:heme-degrading monooxygenase HmoA
MPTISKGNALVSLINVFTVEAANQQKVVDMLFEATEKTMKALPGFISANVHRSLDGVRVVDYAQWKSQKEFEAMRNNPEAHKHMKPLVEIAKMGFHLYEVTDSISL